MRIGQNPGKYLKEVAQPERITLAVLNYIPFQSGFFADTLAVLKTCLESARTEAGLPFDLMVFDNGSCPEVQDWLLNEQREGRIQYLFLSEKNLGKGGAWNIILSGAPGEVIAYADSDVLFYPGWLKASLDLLETFPPDLVLLDLMMPVMDGITFLHHMRSMPRFQFLPVVIVTARDLSAGEVGTLRQMAQEVVQKGDVFEAELKRVLDRFLHGDLPPTAGKTL